MEASHELPSLKAEPKLALFLPVKEPDLPVATILTLSQRRSLRQAMGEHGVDRLPEVLIDKTANDEEAKAKQARAFAERYWYLR